MHLNLYFIKLKKKVMNFFKTIFSLLLIINSFGTCYSQNIAILTGTSVAFKENAKVKITSDDGYLYSTFVKNHSFKFKISATKGALYSIFFPKLKVLNYLFFIKEHSKIHIELDSAFSNLEISGDQLALDQNGFFKQASSISQKYRMIEKEIRQTKDSLKVNDLNKAAKREINKIGNFERNWVVQHRSSPFSIAIIWLFIAQNNNPTEDTLGERYFDYMLPPAKENNYETEKLQELFSTYNNKYADNLFIKDSNSYNYIYLNDKNYSKIPLGSIAPDFNLKDTSGKAISLNNFKGGYLLIDFWASWCGPCRENNPSLKELYRQYKGKGLRVISSATDNDAQKWKTAIKKDKMNWTQGSDLIGAKSIAALRYGITAIPTYILLDPDRKIIMKSPGDIEYIREKIMDIL